MRRDGKVTGQPQREDISRAGDRCRNLEASEPAETQRRASTLSQSFKIFIAVNTAKIPKTEMLFQHFSIIYINILGEADLAILV